MCVCVTLFGVGLSEFCVFDVPKHQLSCLSMLLAEFLGLFFCKKAAPNKTSLYIWICIGNRNNW